MKGMHPQVMNFRGELGVDLEGLSSLLLALFKLLCGGKVGGLGVLLGGEERR